MRKPLSTTNTAPPKGSRLSITPPEDYLLRRDACSYGYFLLSPNHWDTRRHTFRTTLTIPAAPTDTKKHVATTVTVSQPAGDAAGSPLKIVADRVLDAAQKNAVKAALTRMLRLDEPAETIAEFHALDGRWHAAGRGRLMRSPTFFEDVIKTVTSCNVTWPSTITMNRRLCEVLGVKSPSGFFSFPSAAKLAKARPASLRARCSVGYRDARIVELARLFTLTPRRGGIDEAWFEDPATPDDEVYDALIDLPGIGPYAAANIMQLLGRYTRLPLDTESLRHARSVLGWKGDDRALMKRLHAHYAPFGRHAFRSYWFEVWDFYETKRGPAHTWDRETTGATFTAARL